MDTSNWRFRVLLEPRGFIRIIEVILAIIAFATTGGYHGIQQYSVKCKNSSPQVIDVKISYPFDLYSQVYHVNDCTNATTVPVSHQFRVDGDLSPTSQWFLFVGVTAFLYSLASVVFYVVFDASIRLTHDRLVTIGDLAVTCLYTFLWLTAAASWAWGLGQVKMWTSSKRFFNNHPLPTICHDASCRLNQTANYIPLNSSIAFAFLNVFLWACNVWFVYKESPYHPEPGKTESENQFADKSAPPNNM